MEDSMIDLPNLIFDEKIGNKRVRDDPGEVETNIGRLEKRPSGILGVNGGGDGGGEGGGEAGGGDGGGIIETFISNVFHKNGNGIEAKEGEVDGQVKIDVSDFEVEDTSVDLGIDGGRDGGGGGEGGESGGSGGGGGIINTFISNMFNHNGSGDGGGGNQGICDLSNEVAEKTEELGGNGGDGGGGGWMVDSFISNVIHDNGSGRIDEEPKSGGSKPDILDAEKLTKKNDTSSELPSKHVTGRQLKPDDYSERVFFLNNN